MRQPNPKVELASGEYDRRTLAIRGKASIVCIAKLFRITPRQLANYRANYISRRQRK